MEIVGRSLVLLPLLLGLSESLCTQDPPSPFEYLFPNLFGSLKLRGYRYFHLEAEVNYPYLTNTFFVKEFYDLQEGRGRVEIKEAGKDKVFVYLNSTGETFYVEDDICEDGSVEDTPPFEAELVENWKGRFRGLPVLGPSAMFLLGKDRYRDQGTYRETIRGIRSRYWRACDQNLTLLYYFDQFRRTPLRVEVTGYEKGNLDYPQKDQHYEIFVFEGYRTSHEIDALLQVPAGVGCLRTTSDLPLAPETNAQTVYLGLEILATFFTLGDDLPPTYISNAFVLNDMRYGLFTYGYTDWAEHGGLGDPSIVIYDIINGYVYERDQKTGACSVRRPRGFKPSIPLPSDDGLENAIELLESNYIFGSENYTYLGEYRTRGIKSVVFEKFAGCTNPRDLEEDCGPVVITREYMRRDVATETGRSALFPMRLTVKMLLSPKNRTELFKISTNVYDFESRLPDRFSLYDVSECFKHRTESVVLRYTFAEYGVDQLPLMQAVTQVKQKMMEEVCKVADITPLRLPRISVDFDEEGMHVSMRLLERTPYMYDFNSTGTYRIEGKLFRTADLVGENDCARLCINAGCTMFSLCGTSCRVTTDSDPLLEENPSCEAYRREASEAPNPTIYHVTELLNSAYHMDKRPSFSMEIDFDDTTVFKDLSPYRMTISEQEDESVEKIANFDVIYKVYRLGARMQGEATRSLSMLSARDCQKVCLADPDCHALSFCYGLSTRCVTTQLDLNRLEPLLANETLCAVFAKNYLAQFIELPGTVLEEDGQPQETSSAEACGQMCVESPKFTCRSFDFCATLDGLHCYMHSFHDGELNKSAKKKEYCTHYSRSYVADYTSTREKMIKSGRGVAVEGLGAAECARRCSEHGEDRICTAFDVCSSGGLDICHLALGSDPIQLLPNAHCAYYKRAYYHEEPTKDDSKRYSQGVAGGLSFIFIVVGFCIGVFLIFLYRRYRAS